MPQHLHVHIHLSTLALQLARGEFFFYSLANLRSRSHGLRFVNTTTPAGRGDLRLLCPMYACAHAGTFASQWDLNRHVQSVHQATKSFECPYPGCFNGLHAWQFARPDKLTSHIKSCHARRQPDALLDCPVFLCVHARSTLTDLASHIRQDHLVDTNPRKQRERCGDEVEILRAIANAALATDSGHWSGASSTARDLASG